jgi:surface protein
MAEVKEVTDITKIPDALLRRVVRFVAQDAQDGAASLVALRSSSLRMKGAVEPAAIAHAMRAAPTQILSTLRLLLKLKDDPELARSFVGATTHKAVLLSRLVDLSKAATSAPSSGSLTKDEKKNVQAVAVQIIESARGPLLESLKRATVNGEPMYDDPERLADKVIKQLKGGGYPRIPPFAVGAIRHQVEWYVGRARSERSHCIYGPLCLWDVSDTKDFDGACCTDPDHFSADLYWNTSSATTMRSTFSKNKDFTGDLSTWDVSNVRDMGRMFMKAGIRNSGVAYWNTASLHHALGMFYESNLQLDVDLSKWNTKNCEDMRHMFGKTAIIDSGIGRWDVSAAQTDYMLQGTRFSGNLDKWPAKQRNDALNGVLTRFGTRRTASRPTRFGTAKPPDGPFDPRSFFADLVRAKSVQRAESAEDTDSDACTLM